MRPNRKKPEGPKINAQNIVDFIVLLSILAYLVYFFKPTYMLSKTVTTGGDMGSHYLPAHYLINELLPRGRVIGWFPGWYAGIPIFQSYFLPPYLLMAALSPIISLEIAFKLVTAFGIFLLPLCAYLMFRLCGIKGPGPSIAAILTLPFLFIESFSMWGGNIPSTLAGEFTYSISLSLCVLFFGSFTYGLNKGRYFIINSILLALIALNHGYTLVWIVLSIMLISVTMDPKKLRSNAIYCLKVFSLSFALTGFWSLPLVWTMDQTTAYTLRWFINEDLPPPIIWPSIAVGIITLIVAIYKLDIRGLKIISTTIPAAALFWLAPSIGLVDIRYIPPILLFICLFSAYGLGMASSKLKGSWVIPLLILLLTIYWVNTNRALIESDNKGYLHTPPPGYSTKGIPIEIAGHKLGYSAHPENIGPTIRKPEYFGYLPFWIKWNYEGFEAKPMWPRYAAIMDFLKGDLYDPRVKFEHSNDHNNVGTVRVFESIPLFSGKPIIEGLYMHAIHTAPFTFYIQSEMSTDRSCPFWRHYQCTSMDLDMATKHLRMFNTQYIVAIGDKLKSELRANPSWKNVKTESPLEVWELDGPKGYVTVPEYMPNLIVTDNWKEISYEWFKDEGMLDIPMVFSKTDIDSDRFAKKIFSDNKSAYTQAIKKPIDRRCKISENISFEHISFETDCVGLPHIISISHYSSWTVKGADEIYLVSPSFMLVYPNQNKVVIDYGKTPVDVIGWLLTFSALGYIAIQMNLKRGSP